jgi:biotin carboxylase
MRYDGGAEMPSVSDRPSRDTAKRMIDGMIDQAEGRLAGLRKLREVATLTADNHDLEILLYEMLTRLQVNHPL